MPHARDGPRPARAPGQRPLAAAATVAPAAETASAERVIVLNSGDDDISLLDPRTYRQIKRLPIGKEPHHLMATADDRYLIVANAVSNDMVFLDRITGEVIRRLPRVSDPYQIGFSP